MTNSPLDNPYKKLPKNLELFHWSPTELHDSIELEGLKVNQKHIFRTPAYQPDGTVWTAPWICLGTSPMHALIWAGLNSSWYDLWQVTRDPSDKLVCRRDGGTQIIEVRIHNDISQDRLYYVGSRKVGKYGV